MPAYLIFELVALLAAISLLFKGRFSVIHLFIPFLLIIVLYEYATLHGWFTVRKSNLWMVNIILFLSFLFYGLMIRSLVKNKARKRIIIFIILAIICFTIADTIYIQGFWKLNSYAIISASMAIISFICIYLYELLTDETQHIPLMKYPYFWISTGVLFYYLGMFSFFVSFEYMAYKNNFSYYTFFKVISTISNFILYSCLSIAFICHHKQIEK